jgi:tetratricopeptide (TPR) repeat protein
VRLAVALLLIVSQISFTSPASFAVDSKSDYSGWIASVTGGARIVPTGGGRTKTAVLHDKLSGGDIIQTDAKSTVVLVFVDGSRTTLKPNSRAIIPVVRAGARRIKLERGGILVRMQRQKGFDTAVETPSAVAGVRGTTFQVDVDEAGTSTLTVVEGLIEFKNAHGAVFVGANEQSVAERDRAPTRPVVVDPNGIIAWEASVESLVIPIEDPLVGGQPAELERELRERQEAATANPNDAGAQTELGDVLQDLGRLAEADAAYGRALALQPNHRTAREHRALLRLREGRVEEAIAMFGTTIAAAPQTVAGPFGEGLVRLAVGDVTTAVTKLERAAGMNPDSPRPATFLGVARLRQGQVASAEALLRRAVAARPGYYPAHAYLSYALTVSGELVEAEQAARRAVALAPESPLAREALANVSFYAGRLAESRREVARVLQANPLSPGAHLLEAKLLVASNRLPEGIEAAQRAVGLDPQSAVARNTLGVLYMADKDRKYAEREFREALRLAPGLASARTGLATLLAQQGDFRRALSENQAALALDGGSAAAHNNIGAIYLAEGKLDAAVQEFREAIELQPEWGLPYANLGLAYLEQQRYKLAVDAAQRAVKLGERSAPLHTTLARIYQVQQRFDIAETELRRAVALNPDYALAYFQHAQVLLRRSEDRNATKSLIQASISDPGAITDNRLYARTETGLAGGSLASRSFDGKHSGIAQKGDLSYYLSGLRATSDGHREKNGDVRDNFGLGLFGLQNGADHRWLFYGSTFDRAGGRPGRELRVQVNDPNNPLDARARFQTRDEDPNYRSDFSGRELHVVHRVSTGRASNLTLSLGNRQRELRDRNPDSLEPTPEFAEDPKPFKRLNASVDQVLGEARWDARLTERDAATLGVAFSSERRKTRGLLGKLVPNETGGVDFTREWVEERESPLLSTLYGEWRRQFGERFSLTLGTYWGHESGVGAIGRPKVVARYRPDRDSNVAFLAYPTFRSDVSELSPVELWAQPFGFDLLSLVEDGSAMSYELHYDRSLGKAGVVTLSGFHRDVSGLLLDLEDPQLAPAPSRLPVREADITGAQVSFERWLTGSLTGRTWLRYQTATDRAAKELPYFPGWQGGFRFDYLDASGWRAMLNTTWVGSRYADSDNTRKLGGFFLADLRVSKQIGLRQNLFLQINNLFNRSYQRYEGYPEAGRTVLGGVEWRW